MAHYDNWHLVLSNVRDSYQRTLFKSLIKTPLYITFLSGYRVSWSHQEICRWWWESNGILDVLEVLHLGRLGMILDHEEQEREKQQLPMYLQGTLVSSMVQQVQSPCAMFLSLLDHKINNSNSTTTWRRGRSIRRSLLLLCALENSNFCKTQRLFSKRKRQKWRWHLEITTIVSFLVLFLSLCLSINPKPFFSLYMQLVYLLKDFNLNIVERKFKYWSPSMQGT